MGGLLSTVDVVIFFGSLLAVMAIGLWAGRREDSTADFYLAGRQTRWWGVAGSIFGSNVSANHIVGMMGVGLSVGFAQSHFEISAIAGLLLLCYGFLPVYRKLGVFTLSEYLSRRYNEGCRVLYAVIMLVVIVIIQMVPGFYIGSRSLNVLLQDGPGDIDPRYYRAGIVIMAIVTATYTIIGGLKAVIVTDVLQSVLMLVAAVIVALATFSQAEIGGWGGLRALDAAEGGRELVHLYLPSSHPDLPWTGVLSGLMILHFYYWGTNQFIVQRALAAQSDREARLGIIVAGFFKLLIPFLSIGTGIAAYYLFRQQQLVVDQDAAFPELMRQVVAPLGPGIVGLVAAGLIGAILSSIDSFMNSAATVFTFDFYKRYLHRDASEKTLILVGRICIALFISASALLAIFVMDPNSKDSFFLQIASHQSKLVAGVVVAFALGMFWKRATGAGAVAAIITGVVVSYGLPVAYEGWVSGPGAFADAMVDLFGERLNFMHSVFVAALAAAAVHVAVSLLGRRDPERSRLTWTDLGGHDPSTLRRAVLGVGASIVLFALLAGAVVAGWLAPSTIAAIAALWTWALFARAARTAIGERHPDGVGATAGAYLREDRFWAGALAALAVWMGLYYW